jgi:two-component system, OmpR family, sensor histidine kinase VicK
LTESLDEGVERTEVVRGAEKVINSVIQAYSRVNHTQDVCADHKGPALIVTTKPIWRLYNGFKDRGVKIRFITEITNDNLSYCKDLMRVALLRHLDRVKGNFGIGDGKEYSADAKTSVAPQLVEQLVFSNVKTLVEQQQYFFDMLWDKSIPAEQKIKEIEEGVKPDVIEAIKDPVKIQDQYINLLKSAINEIMLIIPTANALKRQSDIATLQLLKESAISNKKINIRILTPLNNSAEHEVINSLLLPSLSPQIQVRNIETASATKSTIIIVDRRESLVAEVKDDSKDTFAEAVGFATYSNSRSTVLSYVSIFEIFWLQTEMYKKVKETEQMQKEFINIAAYELRGPIQPILGLTEVLRNKATDKEQRELQDAVLRSAKKLKQLTEDVLDVTRIESQSLQLHKEQFNLSEMILNTIADLRNQSKKDNKCIKIKLELVSNEDVFIKADKSRLNQVISNLLNNAIKFTEQEGMILTSVEKAEDNYVIVSVKDSGTGINPEILSRLFTKFATKSEAGGTGLGLFISKNIVEAHGGRIWAENNKDGKGATFTFSLPVSKQQLQLPQPSLSE